MPPGGMLQYPQVLSVITARVSADWSLAETVVAVCPPTFFRFTRNSTVSPASRSASPLPALGGTVSSSILVFSTVSQASVGG